MALLAPSMVRLINHCTHYRARVRMYACAVWATMKIDNHAASYCADLGGRAGISTGDNDDRADLGNYAGNAGDNAGDAGMSIDVAWVSTWMRALHGNADDGAGDDDDGGRHE